MKNAYITSYFPLLSLILFSLAFSVYTEFLLIDLFKETGIYGGMLEFFTERSMKLSLLILLMVLYFMILAALKVIADTINELSLLFFSGDHEGESLKKVRKGPIIYLIGSSVSLFSINSFTGIVFIFALTTLAYFIYFVFSVSSAITTGGMIGIIFFQTLIWSVLVLGVAFLALKMYNSVLLSLPL